MLKYKLWIIYLLAIGGPAAAPAWGAGYQTLPKTNCPSQSQFAYGHFQPVGTLAGCAAVEASSQANRIIRGGAPTEAGLGCPESFGVEAVFDLRSEGEQGKEKAWAAARGMAYYSFPLATDSGAPSAARRAAKLGAAACNRRNALAAVDQLEQLLAIDPATRVYVHCARGEDRTGLFMGLYRVLKQGCPKSGGARGDGRVLLHGLSAPQAGLGRSDREFALSGLARAFG